jgi:hypothetical protein
MSKQDLMKQEEHELAQAGSSQDVEVSRATQEVQALAIMAKRFPRDEITSLSKILKACRRPMLAEQAQYSYPRGKSTVSGPSIRLAEVMAQNWGNVDFGIVELSQDKKTRTSEVMAYCWDLETNVRQVRKYWVAHERHTKHGTYPLTDPRDIYEMVANQGARRLRACILGIIPKDIQEAAVQECDKTLSGDNETPIEDRIRTMVNVFGKKFNVTQKMIEKRLGHKVLSMSETELVEMKKVAQSIRDGMGSVEDFFEHEGQEKKGKEKPKDGTKAALKAAGKQEEILPTPDELNAEQMAIARDYFLPLLIEADNTWEKESVAMSIETSGLADFVEPLGKSERELWDDLLEHIREK